MFGFRTKIEEEVESLPQTIAYNGKTYQKVVAYEYSPNWEFHAEYFEQGSKDLFEAEHPSIIVRA